MTTEDNKRRARRVVLELIKAGNVSLVDELFSDRPYRKAWSEEQVVTHLKQKSGVQFDPSIVDRFFAMKR